MVTKIVKAATPPALPPVDAPAPGPTVQVENIDSLITEIVGEKTAEQIDASRSQQAQESHQQAQAKAEAQQQQEEVLEAVQEVADLLIKGRDMIAEMAGESGLLPEQKVLAIWTDKKVAAIALPLIVVMDRHGGAIKPFLKEYGPIVMLGAALALPTIATVKAVRAHRAISVKSRVVEEGGSGE